jgi:hypothetical protein
MPIWNTEKKDQPETKEPEEVTAPTDLSKGSIDSSALKVMFLNLGNKQGDALWQAKHYSTNA